jgi:anti-sigma factor ChrR (cupin superfamily)
MKETFGIAVDVESLLAIQGAPSDESGHYYFLCMIREGELHIQEENGCHSRTLVAITKTMVVSNEIKQRSSLAE